MLLVMAPASGAPFMIVGNDEKVNWDDEGKLLLSPLGRDSVVILDLAEPEAPKFVATLPLKNSVVGPPVNLAIDPTNSVALVADSVDVLKEGEALRQVPDDKVHVIDLKASPPRVAATITAGRQPSGLSISPRGDMALVANRGDNSISVLSINGTEVRVTGTVAMGEQVAHVVFLAVQRGGRVSLHDTGARRIFGVSQQQGAGRSLAFSSDRGEVRLEGLPLVDATARAPPQAPPPAAAPAPAAGDPLSLIERLAELRAKGVLTEEEFAAKKAELLGRL